MSEGISTGMFRMSRWHCYFLMLLHQAFWMVIVMVVIVLALTVTAFLISPWVGIASLGFDLFIVVMCMTFVIAVYGFYSVTACNTSLHKLAVKTDKLVVEFEDGKTVEVNRSDLRPYKIYPGGVLMPVAGAKAGWLWIPPKAFEKADEMKTFLKDCYAK